ncbi:hypothetical protein AXG93_638s1080 [Marchantia polymorpha subsp. ruderalis]|uniref:Uncharacterized protein n=1 Tax=Marchantia polymorpha subsp. ruderalis TaxID=1480154 RepID=A0A176W518_MARPO|nr:hypothetical protein AXG93_638s1080 [Marchantia polymorpha subsp. ruderalis]
MGWDGQGIKVKMRGFEVAKVSRERETKVGRLDEALALVGAGSSHLQHTQYESRKTPRDCTSASSPQSDPQLDTRSLEGAQLCRMKGGDYRTPLGNAPNVPTCPSGPSVARTSEELPLPFLSASLLRSALSLEDQHAQSAARGEVEERKGAVSCALVSKGQKMSGSFCWNREVPAVNDIASCRDDNGVGLRSMDSQRWRRRQVQDEEEESWSRRRRTTALCSSMDNTLHTIVQDKQSRSPGPRTHETGTSSNSAKEESFPGFRA